jgi:hypothetical protein
LKVFGRGRRPYILVVSREARPVAIFPLQITSVPGLGLRRLEFLGGSPGTWLQWVLNPRGPGYSLFNDMLVVPGYEADAMRAFGEWLQESAKEWDEIRLTCVPGSSVLAQSFGDLAHDWGPEVQKQQKFRIDTSRGWEACRLSLNRRQRSHNRYEPGPLEEAVGAPVQLTKQGGEEAPAALEQFIELWHERWAAGRRPTVSLAKEIAFFRALAAAPHSDLVVFSMTAGGRTLACQVGFDNGRRYVPYNFAFDPHVAKHSPSLILMKLIIRGCCADGHEEIDLAGLFRQQWSHLARTRVHLRARSQGRAAHRRAAVLASTEAAILAIHSSSVGQRTRNALAAVAARLQSRKFASRQADGASSEAPPPGLGGSPPGAVERSVRTAGKCLDNPSNGSNGNPSVDELSRVER